MRRVRTLRSDGIDLLARPPCGAVEAGRWGPPGLYLVDQLDEIADLWRRGLLTRAVFEGQRDAVLEAWSRR